MAMPVENSDLNLLMTAAYEAARVINELSLKNLCKFWASAQVEKPIDNTGYTILHFLAFYGNFVAIRKLRDEKLLTIEQLVRMCDARGDTALHVAARYGRLNVVKEILGIDQDKSDLLISSVNKYEDTPIYVAAANGKMEVFYFLVNKVSSQHVTQMKRKDGSTVLHVAIQGQYLVLAYRILGTYPELADRPNKEGVTPLYLLACNKSSFKSGSIYSLKNLSYSSFIPWRILAFLFYYLSFTTLEEWNAQNRSIGFPILAGYQKILKVLPFFAHACEARKRHLYAQAVAVRLLDATQIWPLNKPNESSSHEPLVKYDPLIKAITNSIKELVKLILKKFPEAATVVDENRRNILLLAAETKDTFMYEYLKTKVEDKQKLLLDVDASGNTALHLAAGRRESPKTDYSPLYSMAWDVFWYKHIKMDTPRHLIRHQNKDGLTAKEIFKNSHISKDPKNAKETSLAKEIEEEIKKVNKGTMLVSVLLSAINFAAIFTIPGGFNQNTGVPLFFVQKPTQKSNQLKFFLFYIGVSLLGSLIALGTQLSIQLSRFRKIDFYFILPVKIFIATTAFYYSATFVITACFQAYLLEEALWTPLLFVGMAVACIPATLVYFDLAYYMMNYLYFPIWYKFLAPPRRAILSFVHGKP